MKNSRSVLRVAFDRQRGTLPSANRLAASSRHTAIALLLAVIVAIFFDVRRGGLTRSRQHTRRRGHDPAGLASRIENDYACRGRPRRGGDVSKMCATGARDYKLA